jgi:hypothetical protein
MCEVKISPSSESQARSVEKIPTLARSWRLSMRRDIIVTDMLWKDELVCVNHATGRGVPASKCRKAAFEEWLCKQVSNG